MGFEFDLDADENEEQVQFDPATSDNLKDVRDWGKQGWKKAKAAERGLKELEELRSFKAETEKKAKAEGAAAIFERLGLPKQQALLFTAVSQEVSEEAVKKYATDFGLVAAEQQDQGPAPTAPEAPTPKDEGFRPVQGGGPEGFVDGATYSLEDIQKMLAGGDAARVEDLHKKKRLGLEKLAGSYPTDNRQ